MSLWSPRQAQWLEAMGLSPLALASEGGATTPPVTASDAPRPAAVSGGTSASTPRLHAALLRALRGQGDALAALQVDLDALRTNAAAKRALWPRLRTLRRRGA